MIGQLCGVGVKAAMEGSLSIPLITDLFKLSLTNICLGIGCVWVLCVYTIYVCVSVCVCLCVCVCVCVCVCMCTCKIYGLDVTTSMCVVLC